MSHERRSRLPSPKQLQVLRHLTTFQREHGYSPSLAELGDMLGVSKVTIYQHVRALERKGLLTRLRYRARSLQPTKGRSGAEKDHPARLRLMGTIAAGNPIDVYEVPDELSFEKFFAKGDEIYTLKVEGDSMIDDQIRDGDYVIVEPRHQARPGETVVARLESGEVTLKKFYPEHRRIRLQPANPKMKPIYARNVEVLGVVIGLLRKY